MKKFKFTLLAFMAAMMMVSFAACSDDDDNSNPETDPSTGTDPTTEVNEDDYHFDLFVTVDKHGGMSSKNTTIVVSTNTLTADNGVITVEGVGSELGDYSMESITKGKYYYQIPSDNDRFVKYQIKDNQVVVVAERPFKSNTYKVRQYTHAWIDDNTLVIMSANGDKDKILWTKLDADDLTILDEGELDIPTSTEWTTLTTSGILTYREADNKLFYFYYWKGATGMTSASDQEARFHAAVINPSTMEVEEDTQAPVDSEMSGSAYGQLMQDFVMYDDDDNLYIACFHEEDSGLEKGMLLRIKAGETEFDASYNGYPDSDGKLLTVQYLGNDMALVYARNDASGTKIDSYSHYHAFLDLNTGTKTRLSYNGQEIGYSGGRFSQRSAILNDKVYIGVNTETDDNAVIYIYDKETGEVEKGAEVEGKFYFDMIRVVENDD